MIPMRPASFVAVLGALMTVVAAGCTSSGAASGPASSSAGSTTTGHAAAPSTPRATPTPKPAPAGPAMTAAESRALLAGLTRQGWRCFASISTPFQVDRCFGTIANPPDRTPPGAAQI